MTGGREFFPFKVLDQRRRYEWLGKGEAGQEEAGNDRCE